MTAISNLTRTKALTATGVFLLLFIALFIWQTENTSNTDAAIEKLKEEGFVLHSAQGPVALADYQGKIVVLYFGYTYCPDICPTSLGILSLALNQLSAEELENVQPFFISLDPGRDTPERLHTYTSSFHPSIRGITGTALDIAQIAQQYSVMYMKVELEDSALAYAVDHSSLYYILDRDGQLMQTINHGTDPGHISAVLKQILRK